MHKSRINSVVKIGVFAAIAFLLQILGGILILGGVLYYSGLEKK